MLLCWNLKENRLRVSLHIDPDSHASSATALGQVALQIKTLTDLVGEPFPQAGGASYGAFAGDAADGPGSDFRGCNTPAP